MSIGAFDDMPRSWDARKMCFEQGKACVYLNDQNIIVTEWPNGVVERCALDGDMVEQRWPDGRVRHFHENSEEAKSYPHYDMHSE